MYSGETAVMLLNQLHQKKPYSEVAPHRPLFAFYTNSGNANTFAIDLFSASTTTALRSYAIGRGILGHGPGYSITNNEAKHNGYWWGFNTSYNPTTYGISPASGYVGISQFTQMGAAHYFDLNEEYYWNFDNRFAQLYGYSGVVVGEAGYRQGMNLIKSGTWIGVAYQNRQGAFNAQDPASAFQWTILPGLRRLSTDAGQGYGDIGYNRVANTLAFIERRTNSTWTYRLHIFKNLPKLKANAIQVRDALVAAIASAGGVNYETVDFTWSGVDNTEWHDGTRLVVCDDGSFWMARMYPSSGLYIATISAPVGAAGRSYSATNYLTATTTYGRETNIWCGVRHMVSDDNSVIAVYCPYYYYACGFCIFFLDRRSVTGMMTTCYSQDSTYGYSIAPAGGPNFVMDYTYNNDGQWARGWFVNLESYVATKNRTSVFTGPWGTYSIAGAGGSTNYGGNGVIKVQPLLQNTTEYKERDL